ncbi:HprK-related kinase A [Luteithermobacter gelatinilyticus]|uniref:HprK-related kinase A n=1 Tax=Luteithermobacter gelatinilyticus TaxID=2582913 RepID=UPI00110618CB|nr:HprK-related kinase A [Luteithermobacter gelatinilyticus]
MNITAPLNMTVGQIPRKHAHKLLSTDGLVVNVGHFAVNVRIGFARVREEFLSLYRDYPVSDADRTILNSHLHVFGRTFYRRWIKPQAYVETLMNDHFIPLPARLGAVAAEMGLNWQIAVGCRHYLLFHAGVVSRDNKAVIMPAMSGSGKSTLSAGLAYAGWRLFSDEFGMADLQTAELVPYPRPISLKNEAIPVMKAWVGEAERFSPEYEGTPKGTICYLRPPSDSLRHMMQPAPVKAVIFPVFDPSAKPEIRTMNRPMAFFKLVLSSANYADIGEKAFRAIGRIVDQSIVREIVYPTLKDGVDLVNRIMDREVPE